VVSFFVIISADEGPGDVASGGEYPSLLRDAGFLDAEMIDVTAPYRVTLEAWIREREAEREELELLLGTDLFSELQTNRREDLAGIDEGSIRRFLITALAPWSASEGPSIDPAGPAADHDLPMSRYPIEPSRPGAAPP
jgi:hypothetical protein